MRGMSCSTTILDNDKLADGLCQERATGRPKMPRFICASKLTPNAAPHKRSCVTQTALNNWKWTWLLLALFKRPHVRFGVSSSISNESLRSTRRTEAGMFVPVVPRLKTRPHCHVLRWIACILYRWELKCSLFGVELCWCGILGIWSTCNSELVDYQ